MSDMERFSGLGWIWQGRPGQRGREARGQAQGSDHRPCPPVSAVDGSLAPESDREKGPQGLKGTSRYCSFPPSPPHSQPISKLSATSPNVSTSSAGTLV